ncbi:hypothetical protein C8R45DRAFT_1098257 [Mycena sanguinolenta]|nr:hypothetical protein C8R45DRAFT_1098257 [Mycena sanguinolenta]
MLAAPAPTQLPSSPASLPAPPRSPPPRPLSKNSLSVRFFGVGLVDVGKHECDGTPDLKWVSERVDLSKRRLRSTHPRTRSRDARIQRAGRDECERAGCAAGRGGGGEESEFALASFPALGVPAPLGRLGPPASDVSGSTGMPSFTLSTARTHSYACIYSTLTRTDNDNGFFQKLRPHGLRLLLSPRCSPAPATLPYPLYVSDTLPT